jgi:hypothetical protein
VMTLRSEQPPAHGGPISAGAQLARLELLSGLEEA